MVIGSDRTSDGVRSRISNESTSFELQLGSDFIGNRGEESRSDPDSNTGIPSLKLMVCLIGNRVMAVARLKRWARRGRTRSRGPDERSFSRFSTYAARGARLVQTQTADGDTATCSAISRRVKA